MCSQDLPHPRPLSIDGEGETSGDETPSPRGEGRGKLRNNNLLAGHRPAPTNPAPNRAKPRLADGAFHLKLDQAVHFDAVSIGSSLVSGSRKPFTTIAFASAWLRPRLIKVEELVIPDFAHGGFVADRHKGILDLNVRVGVGFAVIVEQQRITHDRTLNPFGVRVDLEQASVAGAPAILADRFADDLAGGVRAMWMTLPPAS